MHAVAVSQGPAELTKFLAGHETEKLPSRDAIDGIEVLSDGRCVLKARVRAPASEGEANAELIRLIARALGIAPRSVALVAGATARIKRLTVAGEGAAMVATLEKIVPIG